MNPSTVPVSRFHLNRVNAALQLLTLAAISMGAVGAHAQSSVSISGALDGGIAYVTTDRYSQFQTASGSIAASSLVFQGKEDLGGGYAASFLLRSLYVLSTGATSGSKLFGSEAKVGLEGPFGKVELGRLFSPTHQTLVFKAPSQSNFAGAFNLAIGGYSPYWDNSVRYTSPGFSGVNFIAQHSTSILDAESPAPNKKNGVGTALAVNYVQGAVDLTGVVEQVATQKLPATDYSVTRGTLMGTYDFGVVKAHAGYLSEKYSGQGVPLDFNLSILGASLPISPALKLSVEFGHKRFQNSPSKTDFVGLGIFYSLSKRTVVYSEIADIRNKGVSRQSVYRGITVLPGENTAGYTVGMRHTF
ncbi:Outer membrane protein (porin) [Polaromonas sp. OV174]|uniref:porin n=1 Tax=Polaromonas sp. OV174 TaxID=1855300 RepID=UPI0008F36432|nr:porin [Polaromonas sp. OV174]SFB78375.1 Outer membrane protein (porin) [Polaromonas sp. OV174]